MLEWIAIGGAAGVGLYLNYQRDRKARAEATAAFTKIWPVLNNLVWDFEMLLSSENGYFNKRKLSLWLRLSNEVQASLGKVDLQKVDLEKAQLSTIHKFQDFVKTHEERRTVFNVEFVKQGLENHRNFFDHIDGRELDPQQREAVLHDEDHNLVIAGAGSGKTLTISGKVSYLINQLKVDPKEILLMSFTRKSSQEMTERIGKRMGLKIEAQTFHSLGLDIIADTKGIRPSAIEHSKYSEILTRLFRESMSDPEYMSLVAKYFVQYLKPMKAPESFPSHGAYIQYLKDGNIKAIRQVEKEIGGKKTLVRETCKSYDEVAIANFLFVSGIDYVYENPYEYPTANNQYAQYKPDFYLPEYGIYIEHFATDHRGNVPSWFQGEGELSATEKYQRDMEWKRRLHKEMGTKLVETFAYESGEGTLLKELEKKLKNLGVNFSPKSAEEIWDHFQSVAKEEVSAFEQLIQTFISLLKSNNYKLYELTKKNKSLNTGFDYERNQAFLELMKPILSGYQSELKELGLIDFNDMINLATEYVDGGKWRPGFRYIIIDEFQDISMGRYRLVKALLDRSLDCKLFCVGDDWQSIYRFSGSDISIFTEFEKHFGTTHFSKIETTYRFDSQLIKLSGDFILKNPSQVKKSLKSNRQSKEYPFRIFYSNQLQGFDPQPFLAALSEVNALLKPNQSKISVLALSRYSYDIDGFKNDKSNFKVSFNEATSSYWIYPVQYPNLKIEFLTVHKAKGLEADYVIMLNVNSGKYGFPSGQADDPILNLLLSQADQFENGEERRLFYVALTRCRQRVFVTTSRQYTSKFLKEIEASVAPPTTPKCPDCKTGDVVSYSGTSANGNPYTRLTCSNWAWGCSYLEWE